MLLTPRVAPPPSASLHVGLKATACIGHPLLGCSSPAMRDPEGIAPRIVLQLKPENVRKRKGYKNMILHQGFGRTFAKAAHLGSTRRTQMPLPPKSRPWETADERKYPSLCPAKKCRLSRPHGPVPTGSREVAGEAGARAQKMRLPLRFVQLRFSGLLYSHAVDMKRVTNKSESQKMGNNLAPKGRVRHDVRLHSGYRSR